MTLGGERVAAGPELVAQRSPVPGARAGLTAGPSASGSPGTGAVAGASRASGASGAPGASGASKASRYEVASEEDLLTVRHAVRAATVEAGFGLVDQTRIVTAASELARNAYVHGGGGALEIQLVNRSGRKGLRLTVRDDGPGIPDLEMALTDGFTTGQGLGHGLGGARRLMHEFQVHSVPGQGTTVVATRWNDR
ncbi:anti-sigma regulatory factor [Streptomyces ficellus]|uniref:Anti-sigma regulatory factor n=1 Tax=Streptomyces ficellus TaxID=1977088 RepID=A0ABT7Z8G8_9ACTN|nr:anti-sigma regulatory factor [Streptomyces ficellus]MDN3295789.1 anti-sigma regulatory factor [Streptomyces ficellus]